MQPLTHHQIMTLVEPFARRGRHVDLAASNRVERRLVFKPTPHGDGLHETLTLEQPDDRFFRLTRQLRRDDGSGLQASLMAEGADAGMLLQRIDAVAAQRQFRAGDGLDTALSFRLDGGSAALILTETTTRLGDYTLACRVPRTRTMAAELELSAPADSAVALPEDLLAVIGWDWSPLRRGKPGVWTGKVRLRGKEPRRSSSAERKLERTLRHLVATLSRPPADFHALHAGARWVAALRRGIPLLTVAGMIGGVMMLPRAVVDEFSPLRLMMFNLPTLLLAVAFSMQELPRFEIPPWPRPLKPSDWPPLRGRSN
jgi:hypothetical protein